MTWQLYDEAWGEAAELELNITPRRCGGGKERIDELCVYESSDVLLIYKTKKK